MGKIPDEPQMTRMGKRPVVGREAADDWTTQDTVDVSHVGANP